VQFRDAAHCHRFVASRCRRSGDWPALRSPDKICSRECRRFRCRDSVRGGSFTDARSGAMARSRSVRWVVGSMRRRGWSVTAVASSKSFSCEQIVDRRLSAVEERSAAGGHQRHATSRFHSSVVGRAISLLRATVGNRRAERIFRDGGCRRPDCMDWMAGHPFHERDQRFTRYRPAKDGRKRCGDHTLRRASGI
jgi:hypothetical protein